jgi:hypothetical protein
MRLVRLVLLPALALALLLAVPGAAAARKPCTRAGKTVAKNRYVRVYRVPGDEGTALRACNRRTRKSAELASAFDDGYVLSEDYRSVRLARRFAAVVDDHTDVSCKADCPPDYVPTTHFVVVRDLKRRTSRRLQVSAQANELVVTTHGALAWTQGTGSQIEVHALDSAGARVLDTGPIDAGSLAVVGSTLTWQNGGQARQAELGGY